MHKDDEKILLDSLSFIEIYCDLLEKFRDEPPSSNAFIPFAVLQYYLGSIIGHSFYILQKMGK